MAKEKITKRNSRDQLGPPSWPSASLRHSDLSAPAELASLRLGAPNIPRLNRSNPALLDSLERGFMASHRVIFEFDILA